MFYRKLIAAILASLVAMMMGNIAHAKPEFLSDRISVTVTGKGQDVILIPGLGSSPVVWDDTIKAIPGYRYHRIQVSGFAGSKVNANANGSVAAPVAEEIARYITTNKLKSPAVIGHSMGGTIAMMIAARHPNSISKLMIVDMMPFMGAMFGGPGATADSVKPIADQILATMRKTTPEARLQQTEQMIAGMVKNDGFRPVIVKTAMASDPDTIARAYHELITTDLSPELGKITAHATILYVTPTGSPLSDAQMDGYYKNAYAPLKGAVLTRIPDSAHFIMYDAPQRFYTEVKAFLR